MGKRAWPAALLAALSLLFYLSLRGERRVAPLSGAADATDPVTHDPGTSRTAATRTDRAPATPCASHASQICAGGDVHWRDACGRVEDLAKACGPEVCENGACLSPPAGPPCAAHDPPLSEEGRCVGDVLHYCRRGVVQTVDCAARHERCGLDAENGAMCLPPPSGICARIPLGGSCSGGVLTRCHGGAVERIACGLGGGRCEIEAGQARCVKIWPLAASTNACEACGCEPDARPSDEVCDGYDNNHDGAVDEGTRCPEIPIVAFILSDAAGQAVETPERVTADVALANGVLGEPAHDTGLRLALREVRTLARPAWLDASEEALQAARFDAEVQGAGFYVPVLFSRRLALGGKTVAGVSTLPNGTCAELNLPHAGERENGVIIVSRERAPTTLAHEIGHYFGLCHTHQSDVRRDVDIAQTVGAGGEAKRLVCPTCARRGDGVCDTPEDPGAEGGCVLDATTCTAPCAGGAQPDAQNIMSYYTPCRRYFSAEQTQTLRRYLARRLAWRACAENPETCRCTPGDARCGGGSTQMRCQSLMPGASEAFCRLSGSLPRGGVCRDDLDCQPELVCVLGPEASAPLCRPACEGSTPKCECLKTGGPVGGCRLN